MESPVARAEVLLKRALAWARLGAYTAALRDTTAGLASVKSVETAEARHSSNSLLALRAQILLQQGRPRDAIAIATRGRARGGAARAESRPRAGLRRPRRCVLRARTAREGRPRDQGSRDLPRDRSGAGRSGDRVEPRRQRVRGGALAARRPSTTRTRATSSSGSETSRRRHSQARTSARSSSAGRLLEEAETVLDDARTTLRAAEHVTGSIFAETQLARLALVREATSMTAVERPRPHRRRGGRGGQRAFRPRGVDLPRRGLRATSRVDAGARHARRRRADARARVVTTRGAPRARPCGRAGPNRRPAAALEQAELAIEIARRQRLLYEEEQALRVLADSAHGVRRAKRERARRWTRPRASPSASSRCPSRPRSAGRRRRRCRPCTRCAR